MAKDKSKKADKSQENDAEEMTYNPANLAPIAHPLAGKKLTKRILKTVKKGN